MRRMIPSSTTDPLLVMCARDLGIWRTAQRLIDDAVALGELQKVLYLLFARSGCQVELAADGPNATGASLDTASVPLCSKGDECSLRVGAISVFQRRLQRSKLLCIYDPLPRSSV